MQANASSLLINVQELLEQPSHSKDHETEPDSPEVAIDTYLKEPSLAIYDSLPNPLESDNPTLTMNDPLVYWKQHEAIKPILYNLAHHFLFAPPGSVPYQKDYSA